MTLNSRTHESILIPWEPYHEHQPQRALCLLANPKGLRVYIEGNWLPQASSIHQAPSQAPLRRKNRLLHFVHAMWQLSQYSEQECYVDHDLKSLCAREPGENQEGHSSSQARSVEGKITEFFKPFSSVKERGGGRTGDAPRVCAVCWFLCTMTSSLFSQCPQTLKASAFTPTNTTNFKWPVSI